MRRAEEQIVKAFKPSKRREEALDGCTDGDGDKAESVLRC